LNIIMLCVFHRTWKKMI